MGRLFTVKVMAASVSFEFYDYAVFHWINRDMTNTFFSWLFPAITDLHKTLAFKIIVPLLLVYFLLWKRRLEGAFIFGGLIATMIIADILGGKLIKPWFDRRRPFEVLSDAIVRSPASGGSFTSNHASNMFCLAAFLGFFFPRLRPWLFVVASLIAFSRVYVGVHFPSDVIVGAAWGSILGTLMAKLVFQLYYSYDKRRPF